MKERTLEGFGARLTALRQAKGMTQVELSDAVAVSQRVIAYYETESPHPRVPCWSRSRASSRSRPTSCWR